MTTVSKALASGDVVGWFSPPPPLIGLALFFIPNTVTHYVAKR